MQDSGGSQGTVLIVDDDAELRALVAGVVGGLGCRVLEAADGPSALEAASTIRPDLVLLDMSMPGMDGVAVAAELRRRFEQTGLPMVMLSAQGDPEDEARALGAGCSLYERKPCPPSRLRDIVRGMLSTGRGS